MDSKKPLIIRIKRYYLQTKTRIVGFFASLFSFFNKKKKKESHSLNHARKQNEYDKKLVYSLSKSRFPTWKQFKYLGRFLTPNEKRIINVSLLMLFLSILFLGGRFYYTHLELAPIADGVYTEALVGAPQTINPLYSGRNDVDDDLSALVYSSLFTRGINGELQKDLVKDFFVGGDSKMYEIEIMEGLKFHDGSDLTVDDVVFTFNAISDPLYKSPLRQSFRGVRIEVIDDYRFRFLLEDPYAAFLDLLTFGIMPAELWSHIQPESANLAALNLKPIGSGPFKMDALVKDEETGVIREFRLVKNDDYYGKVPFLDLNFKIYSGFQEAIAALNENQVDGISYLPAELEDQLAVPKSLMLHNLFFPQVTLIYLNQETNPALADKATRQALAYAIDRRALVNDVLDQDAYLVDSPILPNSFAYNSEIKKYVYNKERAEELLESVDWKIEEVTEDMFAKALSDLESGDEDLRQEAEKIQSVGVGSWRKKNGDYLTINIRTVERKENAQVIDEVKKYWEEVGVKVNTEVVPGSRILGEVIRPRNFEALFYAQVLGSDPDPYPFWHSSQAGTGFNVASYENKEVDKLLEEARLTAETTERQSKYNKFQEIIAEEEPVIFMYSPYYTYVQDIDLKGFEVKNILIPSDRFANVNQWYLKTGRRLNFSK